MGVKLLLLYVIYQTVITTLFGAVIPLPDLVGKVTPVKPKPLSPSTSRESPITKPSLSCDSKDILQTLFSAAARRSLEYSSPLGVTSSSRPLPVPKIDPSSILDIKLPERLSNKLLSSKVHSVPVIPKLINTPIDNASPGMRVPEISPPYQFSYVPSPSKLPNPLPTYSPSDMYSCSSNTLLSLPNVKSLPTGPMKPLNGKSMDSLGSLPQTNNVLSTTNVLPKSTPSVCSPSLASTSDSLQILRAAKALLSELTTFDNPPVSANAFSANTLPPLSSSYPTPFSLYYKSMYLPRVRTPADVMFLNYRPTSYKEPGNSNIPSQSSSLNLLRSPFINPPTNPSISSGRNILGSSYLNPMKPTEMPNFLQSVQIPKIPSTVPFPIEPVFSAQNAQTKNISEPLQIDTSTASVSFESKIVTPPPLSPSFDTSANKNPAALLSSMSYSIIDKTSNCYPSVGSPTSTVIPKTPLNPPKICSSSVPPAVPSNCLSITALPPACISPPTFEVNTCNFKPTSFDFDVMPNYMNNFKINTDCSSSCKLPNIIPIIDTFVETIGTINTNDYAGNLPPCIDLMGINVPKTCTSSPRTSSYHSYVPKDCVSNIPKCLPPIIPSTPITTIPITPVSYINISPPSSLSQSSSNMMSSINDIVSNIAQNIVSAYMSYLKSTLNNISARTKSNPYVNSGYQPTQKLLPPVTPVNIVNTQSTIPVPCSPIDCIKFPSMDSSTVFKLDSPLTLTPSVYETSFNQLPPSFALQPITASVVPFTSLINYSSPQPCPSYLPSPTLPSYPLISSPFFMEPPVLKLRSSGKDSKEMEKLIELMIIAELLNNDESFDWDDLDTLLTMLSVS